jgi:membrane fusion protein, heavy metal efflux system
MTFKSHTLMPIGLAVMASAAGLIMLSGCGKKTEAPAKEKPVTGAAQKPVVEKTTITDEAAKAAGVEIGMAAPGTVDETVAIAGRVEIAPEGRGEVRAWYPGRIMSMTAQLGQKVSKGQVLARVESSESLQTYAIPAGISGTIIEKNANIGDTTTGERSLYVIASSKALQASFFLFPRDAEQVSTGQVVNIRTLGGKVITAKVSSVLSSVDPRTQTLTAIVKLPATASEDFRPGMAVEGQFVTIQTSANIAVPVDALQTLEGKQVAFVKTGTTYTARPVQIGRQSAQMVEITAGLQAGEHYVTKGAFLIRADIAKSGAEHAH